MGYLLLGLVSVLFLSLAAAKNTYLITMPKTIRPGLVTKIHVHILKAPSPVFVSATLKSEKDATIVSRTMAFDPKTAGLMEIQIPNDLRMGTYFMHVEGKGGLNFANRTKLDFMSKSFSILIQTDRAIYKPGQTVRFRVFGIHPDLSVVNEKINIDIFDPKKNKMLQLKDRSDISGVVTDEMVLSDYPVLGDWRIKVTQGKESREKYFTVAEYVLPKFEVSITVPSFGLTTDANLRIKVRAMYTFGKPVVGRGVVSVKRRFKMWWNKKGFKESADEPFDIEGEKEIKIPLSEIRKVDPNLGWTDFIIEANVTEGITGFKMNDSAEIKFYDTPEKVEFVKSLPSNFKPGLTYTALLRVTQRDGSPIPDPFSRVNVSISYLYPISLKPTTTEEPPMIPPTSFNETTEALSVRKHPELIADIFPLPFPYPRYETVDLPTQYFNIPPDSIIPFDIEVPENVTTVSILAKYGKETAYKDLDQAKSPSHSYVQVRLLDVKPKINTNAVFEIKSTQNIDSVFYQVISKGMVVDAGEINMAKTKWKQFPIFISPDMAPKARMIVQYIRDDGEIVADGITFKVNQIFKNEVGISFDRRQARPGEEVKVRLSAQPNSKVAVLAVDKSVLLLKTGNDITEDEITQELQSYDTSRGGSFPGFWMWRWPMSSGGQDAFDVFDNNGMAVITDALLYNYIKPWDGRVFAMARGGGGMVDSAMFMDDSGMSTNSVPSANSLKKPERVRKDFPETWIWSNQHVGNTGRAELQVTAPDTITSWVATAFAVSPQHGLGLAPGPANLEVFLPFFIRANLPYSVVRDEVVVLQVDIFNYQVSTWTLVVMEDNTAIHNMISLGEGHFTDYTTRVGRWLWVGKGQIESIFFPIIPKRAGEISIKINAYGLYFADSVERKLIVEPEGTPEEYNTPVLIDLGSSPTFIKSVTIDFPVDAVVDSKRIRASAMGDIMGPSIHGIEKLLKMPYGCGEQNMLNFAPNIYVRQYLNVTNHLSPAVDNKAKQYMVKGYQREMTYQHDNGAFSAFGNSDKSGTTWLTAFVVKSFAQAADAITIDEDTVVKAVEWLIQQQNKDGSFKEPGRVLHKAMQGGSAAGKTSLAAFVLIALIEAEVFPQVRVVSNEAIARTKAYLENVVETTVGTPNMDLYELAIMGYALSLARSTKVNTILDELDRKAIRSDGMMYWSQPKDEKAESEFTGWRPPHVQSNAIDIELTAYILLTYASRQDKTNGLMILRWLTTQRNSDGGFSSTQDTVVALQALGDIAALIYNPNFNMRITLTSPARDFMHEFIVDETNALTLQTIEIPETVRQIDILARGRGMSLIEIATYFNMMRDLKAKAFSINVTLADETMGGFVVDVCGSWNRKGASGMAIIEIGVPSGMSPDVETLDTIRAPEYKRMEVASRGLILYFDEFNAEPQCVNVYMMRDNMVADQKVSPVKIYDYYDKSKQSTTFYASKVLSESGVCDVCGEKCFCPPPGFFKK